jgi:bifunctional UDP-N-acetylglucosamine pyrophosphorylase/glucosamine-1-phosphate N-acetyltransferase
VYAADKAFLDRALRALAPNNAQKELYLTDIVAHAAREAGRVATVVRPPELLLGVNDRVQLHQAEEALHARIHDAHRLRGVHVHEGARIDDGIEIGSDSIVESGAHLRAGTRIGARCRIGVGAVLEGAHVADDVAVKPYTVVTDSRIASGAVVGPFSHVRPGSELGERVHIGNFVETKKTTLGRGAKANHLAYLGDGVVGEDVNVGAGTIFCNYDGVRKHVTVIERGAFIGSDSQLVAPVRIGAGAYVGTGTTVTMDVPPGALAVGRARQVNKEGYAERLRARFKGEADAASADTKQGKGSGPG